MSSRATAANAAWLATSVPAWSRFRRMLGSPGTAQAALLRRQLAANQDCAYGKAHRFGTISTYAEFRRHVPVVSYDDLAPWFERIMAGEPAVLTGEPILRLMPTSGSTGARKLIPMTRGLQREFDAAMSAWIVDLMTSDPSLMAGPAYWSVTPAFRTGTKEKSAVPVGFDDDTEYLGGARHALLDLVMAVPSVVGQIGDIELFRRVVLLYLLRCENLRLVSVWHPSYLALLLDELPLAWDSLVEDIARGGCTDAGQLPPSVRMIISRLRPRTSRAEYLRGVDPRDPRSIWPALRMVSCWGDAAASGASSELAARVAPIPIQNKGLLSTEAWVTIPFAGKHPVAVTSHFFEFVDDRGEAHLVDDIRPGDTYDVVVTTAGGLWRYRTGDRIRVSGRLHATPSLHFIGRAGRISDICGEKLSDAFVTQALATAFEGAEKPSFALLAPDPISPHRWAYTLYFEGSANLKVIERLERVLRENPHYDYCRRLGQLAPLRGYCIANHGYQTFVTAEMESGARFGDIKPTALSKRADWSSCFRGAYI